MPERTDSWSVYGSLLSPKEGVVSDQVYPDSRQSMVDNCGRAGEAFAPEKYS
jgi:hypothetical protein